MYKTAAVDKDYMSFDDVCELLTVEYTADEIGQQTAEYTARTVYCARCPLMRQEFYNARAQGIRAEVMLCVNATEYLGEKLVTYNDREYTIYKVYEREDEAIELYCAERTGQDNEH